MNLNARPTNRRTRIISRVLAFAILAAAFVLLPAIALADSNVAYTISGTTSDGGTFSGTIDFDTNTTTGVTTLVNTTLNFDGTTFSCGGPTSNQCTVFDPFGTDYFQALSGFSALVLNWNTFNFAAPPSTFNFTGGYCINCSFGSYDMITGGQASQINAPEPGTWILLSAGLVGLLAIATRRRNAVLATSRL